MILEETLGVAESDLKMISFLHLFRVFSESVMFVEHSSTNIPWLKIVLFFVNVR